MATMPPAKEAAPARVVVGDKKDCGFAVPNALTSREPKIAGVVNAGFIGIHSKREACARHAIINGPKPCARVANAGRRMTIGTNNRHRRQIIIT